MSHAEYAPRPLPVFAKLAVMLRSIPAMHLVLAKFSALLTSGSWRSGSLISRFLGKSSVVVKSPADLPIAILEQPSDRVIPAPEPPDQSAREKLIRSRWAETGIKMWNPVVHGAGLASLNIQGCAELLPPERGEMFPRYDKLEFKLIGDRIVCEDVVLDPPKRRK